METQVAYPEYGATTLDIKRLRYGSMEAAAVWSTAAKPSDGCSKAVRYYQEQGYALSVVNGVYVADVVFASNLRGAVGAQIGNTASNCADAKPADAANTDGSSTEAASAAVEDVSGGSTVAYAADLNVTFQKGSSVSGVQTIWGVSYLPLPKMQADGSLAATN